MKRFIFFVFAAVIGVTLFSLFSCASAVVPENDMQEISDKSVESEDAAFTEFPTDDEDEEAVLWLVPKSLHDIVGTWISETDDVTDSVGFEYPVNVDGRNYIVYRFAWQDCTSFFDEESRRQKITVDRLWEKRRSLEIFVEGANTFDVPPFSDSNGTQAGLRWKRTVDYDCHDGYKINFFYRVEFLIPELIMSQNLNYFLVASDASGLRRNGGYIFRFFSEKFSDISYEWDSFYAGKKENDVETLY